MPRKKKLDNLRDELQPLLKKQYIRGLMDGTKAIAGVVHEKASASNKTAEERIEDILAFCNTSLELKEVNQ